MARHQRSAFRGEAGKLTAAVRHWLDGGAPDDVDDSLAAFGLCQAAIKPETSFKVFAINWPTLQVFWASWSQWRKIVLRDRVIRDGIDWLQVEATLRLTQVKRADWPMIFAGLQAMETAALKHLQQD